MGLRAGVVARTLSDGSVVHDVEVSEEGDLVVIECYSFDHADQIARAIRNGSVRVRPA